MPRLTNPYLHCYGDGATRLTAYVSDEDHKLIRQVIPERGFFACLLNTAVKLTADFCKANNYEYYTPEHADRIHEFLVSRLQLPPATPAPRPADIEDVDGPAEVLRQKAKGSGFDRTNYEEGDQIPDSKVNKKQAKKRSTKRSAKSS